jgi:hypothetical protein
VRVSQVDAYPHDFPLSRQYGWLVLDMFLYWLLALYLDNVAPSPSGSRRSLLYFLSPTYWCGPSRSSRDDRARDSENTRTEQSAARDEEVRAEEERVLAHNFPREDCVACERLRRVFVSGPPCKSKTFAAVKSVTLL